MLLNQPTCVLIGQKLMVCHVKRKLIENAIQTKSYAQSWLLIWKQRFWKSSKTLISTFYYCVSRFFHSFKRCHVKGWRAVLFIYRDDAKSQSKTTGTLSSVWKFWAELSRAKRAQRSTMGKKMGNLCIQEMLVLRKASVRSTSVRTSTPSCKKGWNFAFHAPACYCGKSHSFYDF